MEPHQHVRVLREDGEVVWVNQWDGSRWDPRKFPLRHPTPMSPLVSEMLDRMERIVRQKGGDRG